jgi:hypothetical protein
MAETMTCIRCGAELVADAIANYYRCDNCLTELRNRGLAFQQPDNLLLLASYSPGFATDLTGWSTDIRHDGKLIQNVTWYKPVHGKSQPDVFSTNIPRAAVEKVASLLNAIEVGGISILFKSVSIDDAPFVHLFSPDTGIHFPVTLWDYDDDRIPERGRLAAESFFNTWNLIDSLSPLTVKEHRRSGRTNKALTSRGTSRSSRPLFKKPDRQRAERSTSYG